MSSTSTNKLSVVNAARTACLKANTQEQNSLSWNLAQGQLANALTKLTRNNPPVHERVALFTSGAIDLCIEIVRAPSGQHQVPTIDTAWWVIEAGMVARNSNLASELVSVRIGVDKGLIELAAWELEFHPLRAGGAFADRAFMALANTAGRDAFANRVIAANVIPRCLSILRTVTMNTTTSHSVIDKTLTTLSALALTRSASFRCFDEGIIAYFSPLFAYLHSPHNALLFMCGFGASRVLLRTLECQDRSRELRDNPVILAAYSSVISKVLASGPQNGFDAYGGSWRLFGLVWDLLLIAQSDIDKSKLAVFVPSVFRMLVLIGMNDLDLMHHGLLFFSNVMENESCKVELRNGRDDLLWIKAVLQSTTAIRMETTSLLLQVLEVLG